MTEPDEVDEAAWEAAASQLALACELLAAGDPLAAEPLARMASTSLARILGEQHPDFANALLTLAHVSERRGRLREAIDLGQRAWSILEQWRDEPIVDPMRATAATQLAYHLALAGHHAQAIALSREALALAPAQHPGEANAWINLGVSLRLAGKHDEAEAAYLHARDLYIGESDPLPPALHHNLAGLAFARGEHVLAESHAREALAARERSGTHDELQLGMDLCGLADALAGQGRAAEAEQLYRDGLACYERAGQHEHIEVAFALHNLADALADQARFDEAEPNYRRAIALKLELLGPNSHEVAATLSNLAMLCAELGRADEARTLSSEALVIVQALDTAHPVRVGVEAAARSRRLAKPESVCHPPRP